MIGWSKEILHSIKSGVARTFDRLGDLSTQLDHFQQAERSGFIAMATAFRELSAKVEKMATADQVQKLSDAVTALTANSTAIAQVMIDHETAVQAEITALKNALGAAAQDPAVDTIISNIAAASKVVGDAGGQVKAETDALAASLAPATPPAPPADGGGTAAAPSS